MAKNIFIGGYYGFGNVGDEAVLATLLDDLRSTDPECAIWVTSERPTRSEALHPGIRAVNWRSMPDTIAAIDICDHVIIGGGGVYSSYFSYELDTHRLRPTENFAAYLYALPVLAALWEKPCTVYGVGGGILEGAAAKFQAAEGLACCAAISVRDARTQSLFRDLGITTPITVGADPAFRLQPATDDTFAEFTARHGLDDALVQKPVCVVLRHWLGLDREAFIDQIATALSALAGHPFLLLPFNRDLHGSFSLSDDASLLRALQTKLGTLEISSVLIDEELHPSIALRLFATATSVVSMRLHGCILAVNAGTPVAAIAYDPKVRSVLSEIGLENAVLDVSEVSVEALQTAVSHAQHNINSAQKRASDASLHIRMHLHDALSNSCACLPPGVSKHWLSQARAGVTAAITMGDVSIAQATRTFSNMPDHGPTTQALATILNQVMTPNGEWAYLQAVARLQQKGRDPLALPLLDRAEQLGFAPNWVWHVKIPLLWSVGRKTEANHLLSDLERTYPNHPIADIKAMLR